MGVALGLAQAPACDADADDDACEEDEDDSEDDDDGWGGGLTYGSAARMTSMLLLVLDLLDLQEDLFPDEAPDDESSPWPRGLPLVVLIPAWWWAAAAAIDATRG